MTQENKSALWQELKAAGVEPSKPYRQCTEDELADAVNHLRNQLARHRMERSQAEHAAAAAQPVEHFDSLAAAQADPYAHVPVAPRDPNELAGVRQNTNPDELTPLRKDDDGRIWFQEEVLKPAYPKPRGRRVLTVQHHEMKQTTQVAGQFTESFEIPDDSSQLRTSEVKITLPSYQVGIYQDPRFPMFKTICYNGNEGFDFFDVQKFYGGPELVPAEIQRKYVENVLCYDQRTVIRAIEAEYRQQQLTGGRNFQ